MILAAFTGVVEKHREDDAFRSKGIYAYQWQRLCQATQARNAAGWLCLFRDDGDNQGRNWRSFPTIRETADPAAWRVWGRADAL